MPWERRRLKEFERLMLPWLPAAYRLAYAVLRNGEDAADAVQEACLRAYAGFDRYRGEGARAWLLAIVRNQAIQALRVRMRHGNVIPFDAGAHGSQAISPAPSPEAVALNRGEFARMARALESLPDVYREAILLREIEGLSYQEIAQVAGVPIGTVMSRLHRAREHLRMLLVDPEASEGRE
jgi:RNA polymerase sigma-70 factor (ECF subfamily)